MAGCCEESKPIALCLGKLRGDSQPAEAMSSSGKGLCSMEFAGELVLH